MKPARAEKMKEMIEAVLIALILALVVLLFSTKTEAVVTPGINLTPPPISAGPSLVSPSQVSPSLSTGIPTPTPTAPPASGGGGPAQQAVSTATSIIGSLTGMFPFGGRVITIHPNICGGMVHMTVQTSLGGTIDLMTTGATRFYKYGPPTNPGQNVLGIYLPTQATCSPTRFVSYSGGVVLMMGSSSLVPDPEDLIDKAKSFLGS